MKNPLAKLVFILPVIVSFLFLPFASISEAAKTSVKPIHVYVQNKEIKPANAPVIKGGRVYIEFRSVAVALGLSFKYDKVNKIITAQSDDVSYKIDMKNGTTYIDGEPYVYDPANPMIISSGANTLVMTQLFSATQYWTAEYLSEKKSVYISDDLWGKPKKSDLRTIRAIVEKHYSAANSKAVITEFALESWGSYATLSVDVKLPKTEADLLARLEHAEIEMERQEDRTWTLHSINSETEYLDYKALSQKETAVSEPDKSAIKELIKSQYKALDEKNAKAMAALTHSDLSKEDLIELFTWRFQDSTLKNVGYKLEGDPVIVTYSPDQATVYTVFTMKDKDNGQSTYLRFYSLLSVIKASDGKWYVNPEDEIMLGLEKQL